MLHDKAPELVESYNFTVVNKLKEVEEKLTKKTRKRQAKETTAGYVKDTSETRIAFSPDDPRRKMIWEQNAADTGAGECPEGEHMDKELGKCVPDEKPKEAPIPETQTTEQIECPEGTHEEEGNCVPDVEPPQEHIGPDEEGFAEQTECPEGHHMEDGNCVADDPTHEPIEHGEPLTWPSVEPGEQVTPSTSAFAPSAETYSLAEPCDWSKAGYSSWDDCISKNSDKGNPAAYCNDVKQKIGGETVRQVMGEIKRLRAKVEALEKGKGDGLSQKQAREKRLLAEKQAKERRDQLDKKIQEHLKTLGFNVASMRGQIVEIKQKFEKDQALQKRQCHSIGTLQKRVTTLAETSKLVGDFIHSANETLNNLNPTVQKDIQKLQRQLFAVGSTVKLMSELSHDINVQMQKDIVEIGKHELRLVETEKQGRVYEESRKNYDAHLAKLLKEYDRVTQDNKTLKTQNAAQNQAKIKETAQINKTIEKLKEDNENLRSHVKPKFKAKAEQSTDSSAPPLVEEPAYKYP